MSSVARHTFVNSFVTSPDSPLSSSLDSTPTMVPVPTPDRGVGLSDPDQSAGRRRMLELVNRLHNTGWASLSEVMNTLINPS